MVTRSAEVVGSTSDEATGVLTWLLRTCPFAHSDCSKVGDEKYVTEPDFELNSDFQIPIVLTMFMFSSDLKYAFLNT
ncbi:hypothetical protein E2986_12185 [Frieseomelitta varia]|uniref:Uncharacterized protein n=1 Tax=Frieseomelitta varia TaxID=561572 RepID=A0A833S0P1_9HYME|nr:hypothetical protein E2986_12185 [Frieseomelitta varia]